MMKEKPISTQEWYDFVALVASFSPGMHAGEKEATRKLVELLALKPEDHVLDIGSGSGITAALISEWTGARVSGVDLSPEMVEKARERARRTGLEDRIEFQVGNVFSLDFNDASFDAVVFESLLTILPGDPAAALSEMVRVLKPAGRIGGNEATVDPQYMAELEPLIEDHPAVQRVYTPDTLQLAYKEAGLEKIEIEVVQGSGAPSIGQKEMFKEIGCGGLIAFFLRSYPKLVWKLITDSRFREVQKVDEKFTRLSKDTMGYALIVGQKPPLVIER